MSNLYTNLSEVYEAMYQTFINYEEEFNFYGGILSRYNAQSILEIGCGTGNLANRFAEVGFDYQGMDLSEDMLKIARRNYPDYAFINGDMRDFDLPKPVAGSIITGRTISYLITNADVYNTFVSINRNLKPSGIVCFDAIDANKFILLIKADEKVIHKANVENRKFHRESFWSINLSQSWTFDWKSIYYEEMPEGKLSKIGEDNSTIRAFTKDELTLFLQLTGFEVKEIIDRPSYAFDTFVIVAEKVRQNNPKKTD